MNWIKKLARALVTFSAALWGDVGTVYFWVRESDARRGDFSKVWMVFQCC